MFKLLMASSLHFTAQKLKFSIKDSFSKCDQIRSFPRIWSHLLKKSLMENFIFYAAFIENIFCKILFKQMFGWKELILQVKILW